MNNAAIQHVKALSSNLRIGDHVQLAGDTWPRITGQLLEVRADGTAVLACGPMLRSFVPVESLEPAIDEDAFPTVPMTEAELDQLEMEWRAEQDRMNEESFGTSSLHADELACHESEVM